MGSDEVDPRYAARFQRGFGSEEATENAPTEKAPTEKAPTEKAPTEKAPTEKAPIEDAGEPAADEPVATRAIDLLVVAGGAVVAAAALLVWLTLDPAFASGALTAPDRAFRVGVAAAPGPLLVGGVVALALWARSHTGPRAALAVSFGSALAMLAAAAGAASEFARLASLTAQGPVSSGGIPLPEAAMATYLLRVQAAGVLHDLLPWLVLAALLGLIAGVSCRNAVSRSKV